MLAETVFVLLDGLDAAILHTDAFMYHNYVMAMSTAKIVCFISFFKSIYPKIEKNLKIFNKKNLGFSFKRETTSC
jgi:hypothetical protein